MHSRPLTISRRSPSRRPRPRLAGRPLPAHAPATRRALARAALLAPLALAACTGDDHHDFEAVAAARDEARQQEAEALAADPPVEVLFDPAAAVLPFPNDLFFAGSEDGTLNLPLGTDEAGDAADPDDLSNPRVALNQMDGFSTVTPITTGVSGALDPDSLVVGETIRVFEYTADADGAVTLGEELGPERLAAVEQDGTLALVPLTPLTPATSHAVYIVTAAGGTDGVTGVTGADGRPLGTPAAYPFVRGATPLSADDEDLVAINPALPQLEPLRLATRPLIEAIGAAEEPLAPRDIALAWSVTTQDVRAVLEAVKTASEAGGALLVAPSGSTTSLVPGGAGIADIYVGGLTLPYYQVDADSPAEFPDALNGYWQSETGGFVTRLQPMPAARSSETVPVLMTVPNAASPSAGTPPTEGWPVMIFQHGITRNRTDMLAVAEAMAGVGFATVAIDIPMHGLTDAANPLHASSNPLAPGERTFDIDVLTTDESGQITAQGPDGTPDPSGQHFYNLANLANSRDNLRQGIADLMVLSASLGAMQVVAGTDGATQPFPLDAERKAFAGHSLGGIIGTTFISYDTTVDTATLAMPGGAIAQLLANSPTFGPVLQAGFTAAAGGEFDAAAYAQFLGIAQAVIDSGDPINHASRVDKASTGVHLIEVIGTPPDSPPDQVIPNAVSGAPLAGTEPLARELGLMPVAGDTTDSALVRFARGNHGSIIDPSAPDGSSAGEQDAALAVTVEMQTQMTSFAASGGQSLPVGNFDASAIAPVDATIVPVGTPAGGATPPDASGS